MNFFDGILFLFQLPFHLFHMATLGRYSKENPTTYRAIGLITFIFIILGFVIYGLIDVSEKVSK